MGMDTDNLRRLGATHIRTRTAYEQARDALEPEVIAAIDAGIPQVDIVRLTGLTRERLRQIGKAVERQREQLARLEASITDGTRAAVASLVEHTVDREYGTQDPTAANGARMLALAGLKLDLHSLYVEINKSDRGLDALADTQLSIMVRDGLADRRCDCTTGGPGHPHSSLIRCEGHTEADVPATDDGRKLCGACYVGEG